MLYEIVQFWGSAWKDRPVSLIWWRWCGRLFHAVGIYWMCKCPDRLLALCGCCRNIMKKIFSCILHTVMRVCMGHEWLGQVTWGHHELCRGQLSFNNVFTLCNITPVISSLMLAFFILCHFFGMPALVLVYSLCRLGFFLVHLCPAKFHPD